MMVDGSAVCAKALGIEFDMVARGMGVRPRLFSMLVEEGVVKAPNVEVRGRFEVNGAENVPTML